eukprot:4759757-Amphidinium_carterae.1
MLRCHPGLIRKGCRLKGCANHYLFNFVETGTVVHFIRTVHGESFLDSPSSRGNKCGRDDTNFA